MSSLIRRQRRPRPLNNPDDYALPPSLFLPRRNRLQCLMEPTLCVSFSSLIYPFFEMMCFLHPFLLILSAW